MIAGAATAFAMAAFVVPIALSASPAGAQTTTITTTVPSTTSPSSTSSTTSSTTASTTTTTRMPTSTTKSPPVTGEGIVVIGANGNTILVPDTVDAQATNDVLAQTGSTPMPVWLAGLACLVSGALALTFKPRRHLSPYTLRSSKRS